ncbi:NAD-specific glutamate dehydrogenase [Gossypium arboreum]|uniref:NAD-specific glutamate dehydrogenase n=1 Tax=Gossypium arboreum TaxID=29729 RepID=A0A0B0NMA3_GOSAR|nr:NAD-specific glutamate dehydrogenase [Gossypium arboreum]
MIKPPEEYKCIVDLARTAWTGNLAVSCENISNTFVPEFPDAIFETWTEDIDYASGDGAKKDKGNELEK